MPRSATSRRDKLIRVEFNIAVDHIDATVSVLVHRSGGGIIAGGRDVALNEATFCPLRLGNEATRLALPSRQQLSVTSHSYHRQSTMFGHSDWLVRIELGNV